MKVNVENVGPFDKKECSLSNGVNVLKTSNAGGKTTLAKSLLVPFLFPLKSPEMLDEAEILGVYSSNETQPLLKIGKKHGRIRIDDDEDSREININGKKISYNRYGNERSTICCYMSENSRIVRQMELANPDFEWIPTLLSRAIFYEKIRSHLKNIEDRTESKLDKLERLKESYESLEKKKVDLKKELSRLSDEKRQVEQKRDEILSEVQEIPEELKKKFNDLQNEKEKLEREFNKYKEIKNQTEKQKEKKELSKKEIELKVSDYQKEKDKREAKKKSLEHRINELNDSLRQLKKETDELRKKYFPEIKRIDEEKDKKVEERGKERKVEELQTVMLELLRAGKIEEVTCPVCGSTNVDRDHIEGNLSGIKEELRKINNEVKSLIEKRDEISHKIEKKEEEQKKIEQELHENDNKLIQLNKEIHEYYKKLREFKEEYSRLDKIDQDIELLNRKLSEHNRLLKEREGKLEKISQEIEKLEAKFLEFETSKSDTLQEYSSKIGEIEGSIIRSKNEISKIDEKLRNFNVSIEELSEQVSVDTALNYYKEVRRFLKGIRKQLDEEIENQKLGALRRFNDRVGDIVSKLQFGFSNVYLQSDYRLIVERNGTEQSLSSLSTAERYSLATIIQRAVKEAYLPEIPIFIVDGTLLSFDPERKPKLLEYLEESARENGEVIVVTEVSNDPNIVVEKLTDLVGGS